MTAQLMHFCQSPLGNWKHAVESIKYVTLEECPMYAFLSIK